MLSTRIAHEIGDDKKNKEELNLRLSNEDDECCLLCFFESLLFSNKTS